MKGRLVLASLAVPWLVPGTAASPTAHPARGLFDDSFDYVVVGGGTGGIVMATRLAQQKFKVALVEAGGQYELESVAEVPAADVIPVGSDPTTSALHDWGFVAEKVPGANGRSIHYARGKCLGGSSAMNFMIYQRPTRDAMHEWATAVNDSSYEFDQVLPYYKRSVTFTPANSELRFKNATVADDSSAFASSGSGGPLQVSYANYAMPFSTWMDLGMQAIGINTTDDFNSGSLLGAQYCSSTINPQDELRSSSESSFLATIKPATLTTYTNTLAKKILFNSDKRATGVQVKGALGNVFTLQAQKEVIVSAGAFQSPQLLMVSGVGPQEILAQHQITLVANRPGVGQNMWDHPFFAPSYRVNVPTFTAIALNLLDLVGQFLNMVATRTGPLTNPIADYLAWEKIPASLRSAFSQQTQADLATFPDDWPEAEYISGAGYIGNLSNLLTSQPRDGYQYASMLGVLITPTSRGNVTLQSADTADLPLIQPNWLATQTDQEVAVAMFKRMRAAFQSAAMAPVVLGAEYFPGPQTQTDAQILAFIRENVMTLWHAAGTCKMGVASDEMAVVDPQARVYGVQGLRVVDASAFPFLPPGHPQSTVCEYPSLISLCVVVRGKGWVANFWGGRYVGREDLRGDY
ncbi:GMC family oxidoreductase [Aspergillus saccharolyticus JOP 1030-1]|uniref:Alcohol oxidase n=1 Tax=Aspergillus saccharolyticus JOP 1030-1 TaxID=1450539 RepID=A0A318Z127_9EURO|nr:alcohol oxidase [Aspergillus saccharolyticus JOP 1030-1]PYH40696.1 alcohol oxidase [Aspergillus saccharolyticus JOP 1030-1]